MVDFISAVLQFPYPFLVFFCIPQPNKVSGSDDTPLVNAIRMESLECVKLLIEVS